MQANIKPIGRLVAKYICSACNVKLVESTPTPTPVPPSTNTSKKGVYQVICGSYADKNNAIKQQEKLKAAGFDSFLEFESK